MSNNDKKITLDPTVAEFLAEANEIVDRVHVTLSEIQTHLGIFSQESMSNIYRDMHTLKGTSQLFGIKPIGIISHAIEASLEPFKKRTDPFPKLLSEVCLENIVFLKKLLNLYDGSSNLDDHHLEMTHLVSKLIDASAVDHLGSELNLINEYYASFDNDQVYPKNTNTRIVEHNEHLEKKITPTEAIKSAASEHSNMIDTTIRVQVSHLDRILNLVGELVLIKNQFLQYKDKIEFYDIQNTCKNLDLVTTSLQNDVMKTRMQPIESITSRLPSFVQQMAEDFQKKIDITIEGAETELDKSFLESIKDPITQIIKNSCDHGIETPEERKKSNKPSSGHILLRSFHESGQVVIEISDDGHGLNVDKIKNQALAKKLMGAEELNKLNEKQIFELIFLPNFSTADHVSSVSGRGVGMDIVKTNLTKLGGSVEISSAPNRGTTIQMRIPLTLAIVPSLIVKQKDNKYILAQVRIRELIHVNETSAKIEFLQDQPMMKCRGNLIPLVDLEKLTNPNVKTSVNGEYVVVLDVDGESYGLIVNDIMDSSDVVVRPLNNLFKKISIFSGASILGDGDVCLILDILGISEESRVFKSKEINHQMESHAKSVRQINNFDIQDFLIFSIGTKTDHAIPLCLVHRLEKMDPKLIEKSGKSEILKYRDSIIQMLNLKDFILPKSLRKKDKYTNMNLSELINIIVVKRSGNFYGFIVDEINDILTINSTIDDSVGEQTGILGNLLSDSKIITVIDALGIIEGQFHQANEGTQKNDSGPRKSITEIKNLLKDQKQKKIRVLYAEDVVFFRKHVSKILSDMGMEITTLEDGKLALDELRSSPEGTYNIILSDIEMPNMTGLEFARNVRKDSALKHIPMIALTTRFRDKDIEEGKLAGFNAYIEKLNPETLIQTIHEQMKNIQSNKHDNHLSKQVAI